MLHRVTPVSILGKLLPTAFVADGTILMALKSYFDASGKEKDALLTLAGFAADDDTWREIEAQWDILLEKHGISYIHMREHRKRKFIGDLLMYLQTVDKQKFSMFITSVDMNAYRNLKAQHLDMDTPVTLCNRTCPEAALQWYVQFHPEFVSTASVYFDRGEPFFQPFFDRWNEQKNRCAETGNTNVWCLIDAVVPTEMKKTPGLQMADLLAWGRNRSEVTDGRDWQGLCYAMQQIIPCFLTTWDEAKLRKTFSRIIAV